MRTPREILLQRHRAAEAKLNVMRRVVVGQLKSQPPSRLISALLGFPRNFWLEVICPAQRIWAGLAAVWLLILLAGVDFRISSPQMATVVSPNAAEFLLGYRGEDAWMVEFTAPLKKKTALPKPQLLPPRTERRREFHLI